jgi:hypothetical protein
MALEGKEMMGNKTTTRKINLKDDVQTLYDEITEKDEEISRLRSALEWIADFRFSTAGAATMMKEKANRTLSEVNKK